MGIILFVPAFIFSRESTIFIPTIGYTSFYIASGLVLTAMVSSDIKGNLFTNGLISIGRYSYSIYLFHDPVRIWLAYYWLGNDQVPFVKYHWFIYLSIYLLGSIIIGITVSKIIEFPMLRLRDKLFPRKSFSTALN